MQIRNTGDMREFIQSINAKNKPNDVFRNTPSASFRPAKRHNPTRIWFRNNSYTLVGLTTIVAIANLLLFGIAALIAN